MVKSQKKKKENEIRKFQTNIKLNRTRTIPTN